MHISYGEKLFKNKIKTFLDHEISFNTKISKVIKVLIPTALIYTAFNSFTDIKVLEQMAEDGGIGARPLYLHVARFLDGMPSTWYKMSFEAVLTDVYLPILVMVMSMLLAGIFIGYFLKK